MASFSRALAVDLGATAVRIVEIGPDAKGRPTVFALAEAEVGYDPAKSTDFFPLYSQAIASALAQSATKTKICHLCFGGPAVFSRILKIPAADPIKVKSMIGFEAQQTVPAIEQALWDYQLLPSIQPGEVDGLILAIKKETVEELSAAAAGSGLKVAGVTLAPASLLNSFYFNYPDAEGCSLILDLGARATTILLVEGSRIFVRVVPLGGATITQAIATDLQESYAGSETLKKAKGFVHPGGAYEDSADATAARISKLARGVMTRLHAEVERSITFFRSQQGGGKPVHGWLAGGGAMMGYTDLFFREKLRIPMDYFQPFRRLGMGVGRDSLAVIRNFPAWTSAVGTGLQGFPETPLKINVMSSAARSEAQKFQDRPAMAVACLAGILLLLSPGLHGFWLGSKTGQRLAKETEQVEEASRVLQKLEAENKKFLATAQQIEAAMALEGERLRWPKLLEELKKNSPKGLWITSLAMVPVSTEFPASAPGPAKTPPATPPVLEIGGMFETKSEKADAEAVANFQKALDAGGVLQNVTVLEREAPQYIDGKTDQVALKFRLRAEWPTVVPAKKNTP